MITLRYVRRGPINGRAISWGTQPCRPLAMSIVAVTVIVYELRVVSWPNGQHVTDLRLQSHSEDNLLEAILWYGRDKGTIDHAVALSWPACHRAKHFYPARKRSHDSVHLPSYDGGVAHKLCRQHDVHCADTWTTQALRIIANVCLTHVLFRWTCNVPNRAFRFVMGPNEQKNVVAWQWNQSEFCITLG